MKNFLSKIIIFLIIFAFSLLLTNDWGFMQIENTAIITAIGIDLDQEKNLDISAQIALPQPTTTSTDTQEAIISGKGKTIGMAIDNIGTDTGWFPKLSFCNIIVIQQDLINSYLPEVLNYLLFSAKIYDSALIVASYDKASEVIKAFTPLDNISSFSIQKILLRNSNNVSGVYFTRAKDLSITFTEKSNYGLIPLIKINKDEKQNSLDKQKKDAVVFNLTDTLLISNKKVCGKMQNNQTLFFNLLHKKVEECYFDFSYDDMSVLLKIISNKSSKRIEISLDKPKMNFDLELKTYIVDVKKGDELYDIKSINILPKEIIFNATKYVENMLDSLTNLSLQSGCDFFEIKTNLYRNNTTFFKQNNKMDFLSNTTFTRNVKIVGVDN